MLMMRVALNAHTQWGCKFMDNGTMLEPNMTNCPKMQNATEWLMQNKDSLNKDVIKNALTIMLAMKEAIGDIQIGRILEDSVLEDYSEKDSGMGGININFNPMDYMDILMPYIANFTQMTEEQRKAELGENLYNRVQLGMKMNETCETDKDAIEFLKSNPKMIGEIDFKAVRTMVRKPMKPKIKEEFVEYYKEKLAAFKAQRECFTQLMKVHTTMQCASMSAEFGNWTATNS